METVLQLGVLIFMILFCKVIPEIQFHNYLPPEGQKIDYHAMWRDREINKVSQGQIMRNTVNGKYNVPKENGGNR